MAVTSTMRGRSRTMVPRGRVGLRAACGMLSAVAAVVTMCGTVSGQSSGSQAPAAPWSPPRLADGQPDLQGVYVNAWQPGQSEVTRWENHTPEERAAYARRIIEVRGKQTNSYGSEWVEVRKPRRTIPFAVI